MFHRLLLTFALMLVSQLAMADAVRFVTGTAQIKLRSDVGEKALIIQYLLPGTKVTELSTSPDGAYSRVRLAGGMEGWLPTRSLVSAPPPAPAAAPKTPPLPAVIAPAVPGRPVDQTEVHIQQLTEELSQAQQQLAFLRQAAARPKQLEDENAKLHQQVVSVQNDLRLLQEQNLLLQNDTGKEGFVIGALVFFAGILFGLFVPRLLPRKKSMWKEL